MSAIRDDPPADRLDHLLAKANALIASDVSGLDLAAGFDDLFADIVSHEPLVGGDCPNAPRIVRRRRSRPAVVGISLAATILVGTAGAAAANWTSVYTGIFGSPGSTENDTSQWLNLSGDNLAQAVAQLGKDIPFPPGVTAATYAPTLAGQGQMTETDVKAALADDAQCAWWGNWLQAQRSGDAAAQAQATAIIEQVPTWPIVVQTDGGGTVTYDQKLAVAAEQGDAALIQQSFTANSCAALPQPKAGS